VVIMKATSMSPRSGQRTAPSDAVVLLHGHQLERNLARAVTAEAVGTFVLVLAITSAAVAAALSRPVAGAPFGSLAVPVAGGLALAIAVAALGHISGAHLNPAVTLGLAVNRHFPWACVPGYIIAQFTGAIAAAAVTWGLYGDKARSIARLGATVPAAGVSVGRVLAAEAVVTFVLVLVVVAVATDTRVPRGIAAIAIGAALAVAIVIAGPVSGAGVNPARAIAPMILTGQFPDWWAYLTAPLAGAAIAITLYDRFLRAGNTPGLAATPADDDLSQTGQRPDDHCPRSGLGLTPSARLCWVNRTCVLRCCCERS
jgi:MIP family channel proteins